MQKSRLEEYDRGWFVGGFEPTLLNTQSVEVAVKRYQSGAREEAHYHKIATEITVIVSGRVRMNGCEYSAGDIIKILPVKALTFTQ